MYHNAEHYSDPTSARAIREEQSKRSYHGPKVVDEGTKRLFNKIRSKWNDQLNLCYFCGGRCEIIVSPVYTDSPDVAFVRCKSCLARGPQKQGLNCVDDAIKTWNDPKGGNSL